MKFAVKIANLEILATQDALTGCLNRRSFFEAFESLWIGITGVRNKTVLCHD